jgi:Mg2+ and Co2+ transporter CorA
MIQVHVFRKGQELRDVPVADLSEVRAEPRTLVWVDLVSATPDELGAMGEEFKVHEMALASCAAGTKQRPRVEEYLDRIGERIEDLEEAVFQATGDVQSQIFSLLMVVFGGGVWVYFKRKGWL